MNKFQKRIDRLNEERNVLLGRLKDQGIEIGEDDMPTTNAELSEIQIDLTARCCFLRSHMRLAERLGQHNSAPADDTPHGEGGPGSSSYFSMRD